MSERLRATVYTLLLALGIGGILLHREGTRSFTGTTVEFNATRSVVILLSRNGRS